MTRRRFWFFYVSAWLPYALSYFVLFRNLPGNLDALRWTLYNIAPAAAAGVLIVLWTKTLSWRLQTCWWFYPAQVGSAVTYSSLWYFGVLIVGIVDHLLATHQFRVVYFSGYALQWQFVSGLMVYGNIAGVMYVSEVNQRLRQEERRRAQAESLRTTAELSALRAQLNPHFLFNTLNSIMALAGPGQPRTMQAIAQLAAMLRYSLSQNAENEGVSLRQELDFTNQYLALEFLRFGERLRVTREIDAAALACRLPPLTLQPLVENAIRHGIEPRAGAGSLVLRASVLKGALHLEFRTMGLALTCRRLPPHRGWGCARCGNGLSCSATAAQFSRFTRRPGAGAPYRLCFRRLSSKQ